MQRLYDDDDSMNALGHDNPFAQHDIRSDYCRFRPLFRDCATNSADLFVYRVECGIRHPHP